MSQGVRCKGLMVVVAEVGVIWWVWLKRLGPRRQVGGAGTAGVRSRST